jgi:hypothetical protein
LAPKFSRIQYLSSIRKRPKDPNQNLQGSINTTSLDLFSPNSVVFNSSSVQMIKPCLLNLRSFAGSRFQIFASSRLRGFACSRFLKTHFTNFIITDVSRVTGFPEFPNTMAHRRRATDCLVRIVRSKWRQVGWPWRSYTAVVLSMDDELGQFVEMRAGAFIFFASFARNDETTGRPQQRAYALPRTVQRPCGRPRSWPVNSWYKKFELWYACCNSSSVCTPYYAKREE